MTCREFTDFLEAWFSGELPADRKGAFERHLGLCDNCAVYLSQYEATMRLGREAFAEPEAEVTGVPEDLVRAVMEARRRG